MTVFVDSHVILDLVNRDAVWLDWSRSMLELHAAQGLLVNAMVYAELCGNAQSPDEVDTLLNALDAQVAEISRQALFDAAKAHITYRRSGGTRTSGLPDVFIGAHAQALGIPLLSRDTARHATYFPQVRLICP